MPIDDRPVTSQLPLMLGRIAAFASTPRRARFSDAFSHAGRSDALIAWLNGEAAKPQTDAFVISTDMLAYGGLTRIASSRYHRMRTPTFVCASSAHLRARRPRAWIGAFGTIMRLAPTGIPAGTPFFAPYPVWQYLQEYANLHDPPLPERRGAAQRVERF